MANSRHAYVLGQRAHSFVHVKRWKMIQIKVDGNSQAMITVRFCSFNAEDSDLTARPTNLAVCSVHAGASADRSVSPVARRSC